MMRKINRRARAGGAIVALLFVFLPGLAAAQAALPSSEVVAQPVAGGFDESRLAAATAQPPVSEMRLADGTRVVAFEWIMLVSPEQRQLLAAQAPGLMRYLRASRSFSLISGELLTFAIPADLDQNDAVLELVPESLRGQLDRNHIYSARSRKADAGALVPPLVKTPAVTLRQPFAAVCQEPLVVGMVDSWIDLEHPAFAYLENGASRLINRNFVETTMPLAKAHGTAVAALFLGAHSEKNRQQLSPLLPNAYLLNASVFHAVKDGEEGASASRVLAALDWLVQQAGVQVVNMSLAGPPNRLLARTLVELDKHGVQVVAAVGNDGPFGPERFPAAYAEAVGVAATRANGENYRWSNQGTHVDFAALGADIITAGASHAFAEQSGTSLAAPIVSAFLACHRAEGQSPQDALDTLAAQAVDLGLPGKDVIFGYGLLHP